MGSVILLKIKNGLKYKPYELKGVKESEFS